MDLDHWVPLPYHAAYRTDKRQIKETYIPPQLQHVTGRWGCVEGKGATWQAALQPGLHIRCTEQLTQAQTAAHAPLPQSS